MSKDTYNLFSGYTKRIDFSNRCVPMKRINPFLPVVLSLSMISPNLAAFGYINPKESAKSQYQQSLLIAKKSKPSEDDTANDIKQLISKADDSLDERDLDSSKAQYQELINKLKDSQDKDNLTHCYKKLGVVYTLMKNYDQAIASFNSALELNKDVTDKRAVLNTITIKYSLARAYESKGDVENALVACNQALDQANSKLSDSPYLIRRLRALKSELFLSNVSYILKQEPEKPDHPKEFTMQKPLVGNVKEDDYFKAKGLLSEVPKLDTSHMKKTVLKSKTKKTVLFTGTKKVKNSLTKKVMEYGVLGLSLKKDVPGFPWYVKYVLPGGAGQRAGIQKKDILLAIDGHPVQSLGVTRIYHLSCGRRGQYRTLTIKRKGQTRTVRAQLLSVYDISYAPTKYIEYYWFLLYNGYITGRQYGRLAKPYEKYLH